MLDSNFEKGDELIWNIEPPCYCHPRDLGNYKIPVKFLYFKRNSMVSVLCDGIEIEVSIARLSKS